MRVVQLLIGHLSENAPLAFFKSMLTLNLDLVNEARGLLIVSDGEKVPEGCAFFNYAGSGTI